MINGETKTGFKFEIDERALTDWNILQSIADIESGDNVKVLKGVTNLANTLLGDKGLSTLLDHVRKCNDGYAPADKVQEELIEMFKTSEQAKKS